MNLGERIKKARKEKKLSQAQLGSELGVSGSMIGQYENNLRNPKLETVQRIAAALDVDVNWLMNGYTLDERRQAMIDYAKNRRVEVQAEKQILDGLRLLNAEGKIKIADYIDDLVKSGKYQIQHSKALDGTKLQVYGNGPAGNFPPYPGTSSAQEGDDNNAVNSEDDE